MLRGYIHTENCPGFYVIAPRVLKLLGVVVSIIPYPYQIRTNAASVNEFNNDVISFCIFSEKNNNLFVFRTVVLSNRMFVMHVRLTQTVEYHSAVAIAGLYSRLKIARRTGLVVVARRPITARRYTVVIRG